jgi:hypothetical protein
MATVTASTFFHPATMSQVGIVPCVGQYSTTLSAGDIIKCGKIPHGAIILSGFLFLQFGAGDATLRLRRYSSDASSTTSAGLELITNSTSGNVALGTGLMPGSRISCVATSKQYMDLEIANASAVTSGIVSWNINYTVQPPWSQDN